MFSNLRADMWPMNNGTKPSNRCEDIQVMIHQNQISLTNIEAQPQGHGRQTTHFIFPGYLQLLQLHRLAPEPL